MELRITSAQGIQLLKHSQPFRSFYNSILEDSAFEAFFWENPATSIARLNHPFEFVLVKSKSLSQIKPNPAAFHQYFTKNTDVVHFPNLGKDAYLIVPCPVADKECYAHLAAFVRKAPEKQADILWQNVGEQYERKLTNKPLWLSTAGLGVSWLHLRLDTTPKYYRFSDYKLVR